MLSKSRFFRLSWVFVLAVSLWPGRGNTQDASGSAQLLQATEAFRLSARIGSPGMLRLRWDIAPQYYLYRGRIQVRSLDANERLGELRLPDGLKKRDPYLGDVEIYREGLDAAVPYSGTAANLRIAVTFQGCHEVDPKICYPPATQTLNIPLSGADAGAISLPEGSQPARGNEMKAALRGLTRAMPAPAGKALPSNVTRVQLRENAAQAGTGAPAQSLEQKLAGLIGAGGFAAIALFFVAGLGLAFTACVLPMIPILSGMIIGAGEKLSTTRAFALSLVYVLASCAVFTALGIIAGLAGANLAAWMQKPAIIIAFALLFVALALSMFGLYSLQLPPAWQTKLVALSNRRPGGSFAGVAVMGVLSALIVGPCVTPALGGAVLYIGQTRDPVFGGAALFALSFGMGVPLLVIGTAAGRLLPRAGAWMDAVKAAFGVLFLGVAIWMLSRVLDMRWVLAMTGALLLGCGVWLGALSRSASGWRRAPQALGLVALVIGACELVGAAAGSRSLTTPLAGVLDGKTASAQTLQFRRVKGVDEIDRAVAAATASGKPAILEFYADWCVSCKEMEALTFTKPDVQRALAGFVLLRADVTANDANDQALLKHYGLLGPPATLFFSRDGREQRGLRLIGYEDAGDFVTRLHKAAP